MTRVALLWHMHQPFYEDLATGEHILPWVRLHALKDYFGMVALLREFPNVKLTFNLVPSLLVQLEAFASGRARDPHLEIGLKPADQLSLPERMFCLEHFFRAHQPRMIDPYPRYAELLGLRDRGGVPLRERAGEFAVGDLRDLQVWHKLAWLDPYYHDGDERVRRLVAQGRDFREDDKRLLREVELELLGRVIPEYRTASDRGQVELSTSPFYHPILPLLCDSEAHLVSHPQAGRPRERFRRPEDAREQLGRAVDLHRRLFGRTPLGVWPSEGSVSDAMVPLVADAGFRWMATDEGILSRTLGKTFTRDADGHVQQPEALYMPYRIGAARGSLACGFRDHTLSDLIGFTYASWSAEAAAADFVGRLAEAGRRYTGRTGQEATVFVILDGENAWEHYDGQGRPFLRALYSRLNSHPEVTAVTMADACSRTTATLPNVFPGSWINNDFYIWMGHADDHRAWSQLGDARRALDAAAGAPAESLALAKEEILIAEGSDWFWWYGDDHSSENDRDFDQLFRTHVGNVYRALGQPVPEELLRSNITTQPAQDVVLQPTDVIAPVVDGDVTSYFEWLGAGAVEGAPAVGAMHRTDDAVTIRVQFGCSADRLYVRADGNRLMSDIMADGSELSLVFSQPQGVVIAVCGTGALTATAANGSRQTDGMSAAVGAIAEVGIPFAALGVATGETVAFTVVLSQGGGPIDQQPRQRAIEVRAGVPAGTPGDWSV